jgi:outer membrane protein assembly factor BamB
MPSMEKQLSRARFVKLIMFSKRPFVLATIALLLATALAFSRSRPAPAAVHLLKPADWPTYRSNQFRTGSLDHIDGPTTPKILWTFRETAFTPSDFSSSPAIVGNRVYVASANIDVVGRSGFIYCLNANTGQRIWQVPTKQEVYCSPAVVDGRVYVGEGLHENTGSLFRCLDAKTGDLLWQFKTNSHAEGPSTIKDGRVYFGAGDDGLYCLSALTGQKIWQFPGYHIDESPVICGDILLVGTGYDRATYLALSVKTGDLLWSRPMQASVWGTSALCGDRVYFGLSNAQVGGSGPADLGKVYCLDIKTGHDIWSVKLPRAVGTAMTLADDQLFFGCWDGNVYCLNPTTGKEIWKTPTHGPLNSSPALDAKRLYIGTTTGEVLALNRTTGHILWNLPLPATALDPCQILSSPALINSRLYLGTTNNQFVCIGQ